MTPLSYALSQNVLPMSPAKTRTSRQCHIR
jgi:hypothetical protein